MLISEFARTTNLTVDTVRFYVRKGILSPELSTKGGSKPYQIFTQKHVDTVKMILVAKSVGFSIRQILGYADELQSRKLSGSKRIEILRTQIGILESKANNLKIMIDFMYAKVAWYENDRNGLEPQLETLTAKESKNPRKIRR